MINGSSHFVFATLARKRAELGDKGIVDVFVASAAHSKS